MSFSPFLALTFWVSPLRARLHDCGARWPRCSSLQGPILRRPRPLPAHSLYRRPALARTISWGFTVWEGCFPLALLDLRLAAFMCASGVVFHFLVFWYFGLNRFFWAWLASFPAVLYCAMP